MEIGAIFERLPDTANARPELVRLGRHCDVEFLLEIGEQQFLVAVRAGRVIEVHAGTHRMRAWRFAIRAAESAWREFWSPTPKAGFNDIFAMSSRGHAVIEGDVGPLLENLRYIKEIVQLPRTIRKEGQ